MRAEGRGLTIVLTISLISSSFFSPSSLLLRSCSNLLSVSAEGEPLRVPVRRMLPVSERGDPGVWKKNDERVRGVPFAPEVGGRGAAELRGVVVSKSMTRMLASLSCFSS